MKTSNYLIIGFLIFFFGSITVLHIDSKLHEEAYKERRTKREALRTVRSEFFNALQASKDDKENIEKWDDFIQKSKVYFSNKKGVLAQDINSATWYIFYRYKKLNKLDALLLSIDWAKKGVEISPNDPHMAETYANLLFENGNVEEAIKYQQMAVDTLKKQGHKWTEMYNNRLERFKAHLKGEEVNVGKKFIDVTLQNLQLETKQLSELIINKVALLTFWSHNEEKSVEAIKKLYPICKEFNNSGFTVIGISKENVSNKGLTSWLEKKPTPWTNYLDYQYISGIKYDAVNIIKSRTILIDKNGIIVAIDPPIDELRNTLKKILN